MLRFMIQVILFLAFIIFVGFFVYFYLRFLFLHCRFVSHGFDMYFRKIGFSE